MFEDDFISVVKQHLIIFSTVFIAICFLYTLYICFVYLKGIITFYRSTSYTEYSSLPTQTNVVI